MRVYYGWYIVAVALVILTLVMGSTFHSFGVFVRPVSEEWGLSRADTNTGFILFSLGGAIWAPIIGKMLDRLPIHRVMLACAILMGASLAALGLSHSVVVSAIVMAGPLAIAVQGAGSVTATTLVARWFSVHRGRAMAIALFGVSLAGIVVTPTMAVSVEQFGWRTTLVGAGAIVTLLLLAMLTFVRERPGPHDVEDSQAKPSQSEQTKEGTISDTKPFKAAELLLMPQFWSIGLACGLTLGITQAVMVTFVPLAEATGVTATRAASLIAVLSIAGLVGGFATAWLADRFERMMLLSALFVVVAITSGLIILSDSFVFLIACAALLGFTTGIVNPVFFALIADRFGSASFGTAYGLMTLLMTVCAAISLRYAGEVFDRTASYDFLFLTIIGIELIAAIVIFATRVFASPSARASGVAGISLECK